MAAKLSNADQTYLSPEQQEEIKRLKAEYAAASVLTDPVLRAEAQKEAHRKAEEVRAKAAYGGYSAGTSGTDYTPLAAKQDGTGGQNDQQVKAWLDAYQAAGYDPKRGWVNGYDVDTNTRSKANYVRQQMEANSKAWHGADKETQAYLHDQNVKLADLLAAYTGHATGETDSGMSYGYDEKTGQWWTWDANNGYGRYVGYEQPNIRTGVKNAYGYTDEQMEDWSKNRSGLYRNFVDARIPARNQMNESGGFTGRYAQFANGPYAGLLAGSNPSYTNPAVYSDLVGDGFHDENDYAATILPEYGENGNIVKRSPQLKGNNDMSDYTKQFAAYIQNGVIMPNSLQMTNPGNAKGDRDAYLGAVRETGGAGLEDGMSDYQKNGRVGNNAEGQRAYQELLAANRAKSGGLGAGGYASYIDSMYDNALKAQLSGLESSYTQNLSDLDSSEQKIGSQYTEQRRQTTGQSAQDAAAWREMANAYGLNSGAIGQAALAQNNQLQSNLNTLQAAESTALDEIERNRILLGQQYQSQINEAIANNDKEKAYALYQEAVRAEEQMIAQMQFNAQMGLQYAQMAMQQNQWAAEFGAQQAAAAARSGGSGAGSSGSGVQLTKEELQNQLYADAYLSSDPEYYIRKNYKNYGLTSAPTGNYQNWLIQTTDGGTMANADMNKLANYAAVVYGGTGRNSDYLVSLLRKQGYSDTAIDLALAKIGL